MNQNALSTLVNKRILNSSTKIDIILRFKSQEEERSLPNIVKNFNRMSRSIQSPSSSLQVQKNVLITKVTKNDATILEMFIAFGSHTNDQLRWRRVSAYARWRSSRRADLRSSRPHGRLPPARAGQISSCPHWRRPTRDIAAKLKTSECSRLNIKTNLRNDFCVIFEMFILLKV
jgi:hypothetical protein